MLLQGKLVQIKTFCQGETSYYNLDFTILRVGVRTATLTGFVQAKELFEWLQIFFMVKTTRIIQLHIK